MTTVSTAERRVRVGAADEHLVVADARQHADVILTVVLQRTKHEKTLPLIAVMALFFCSWRHDS